MIKDYLVNFLSVPAYAFTVKKLDQCVKEVQYISQKICEFDKSAEYKDIFNNIVMQLMNISKTISNFI